MVDKIQYRWDFIGLSTDTKPTPETNDRVANGSTFYCSDNSKLYVWYKDQWYEKTVSGGGGGGGTTYTAGEGIDITDDTISVDTDTIQEKLTAGTGIDITGNTISATGGSGPTVVQTTGQSTTDVMSQNAVTSMVFADPSTTHNVQIGSLSAAGTGDAGVAVGFRSASGGERVAIGRSADASASGALFSVALGSYAKTSRTGEVNISTGNNTYGYNNTNYRVLGGVHDPVDAHDAATKGYCDTHFGEYNIYYIANAAYDDPEISHTISASDYEGLRTAVRNGERIVYMSNEGGAFYKGYCGNIDMPGSNSMSLTFGSDSLYGSFSFSWNNGTPTVTFTSNEE